MTDLPLTHARGPRTHLVRVLIATILWYVAEGMVRPVIAVLLRRMGLDGPNLAVALAGFNLAPIVLAIPLGGFCRRRAPHVVLGFGCLLSSVVLPLYTIADTVSELLALQILAGSAMIAVVVAGQIMVSSLPSNHGLVFPVAHYGLTVSLGGMVGPLLGGIMGELGGLSVPIWVGAGLNLVAGLVMLMAPVIRLQEKSRALSTQAGSVLAQLVRRPLFQAGLVVSFGLTSALTLRTTYYAVFLEERGWSLVTIGSLVSLSSGAAVAVRIVAGAVLSRIPLGIVAGSALLLGGLGIAGVPMAHDVRALAISAAVWGIAVGFNQPLGMLLTALAAPEYGAELAVGSRVFLTRVAALLLPLTFGLMAMRWGDAGGFYTVGGGLGVLGVLLTLALWRHPGLKV